MEERGSVLGVEGGGGVTAMSTRWNPGGSGGPNGVVLVTGARTTSSSERLGEVCIGDTIGELAPLPKAGGRVGSFLDSCTYFPLAFFFRYRSRDGVSSAKECSG